MTWRLADVAERQRVVVMVSQYAHCLHDLLFRNSVGELHLDVVAVVSNHPDLRGIADFYGVPFPDYLGLDAYASGERALA